MNDFILLNAGGRASSPPKQRPCVGLPKQSLDKDSPSYLRLYLETLCQFSFTVILCLQDFKFGGLVHVRRDSFVAWDKYVDKAAKPNSDELPVTFSIAAVAQVPKLGCVANSAWDSMPESFKGPEHMEQRYEAHHRSSQKVKKLSATAGKVKVCARHPEAFMEVRIRVAQSRLQFAHAENEAADVIECHGCINS